jgi:hypothetical protein
MPDFPGGFSRTEDELFDERDAFVPEHLPEPGPFLADQTVLTGDDHVAVHAIAHEVFEARSVYDMTFNYNLARLNRDTRHPDAGFRYAEEATDHRVLRAAFTPTTPFCPQSHTLTIGAFRAWNGLTDRHDYSLIRVRVAPMHQQADAINGRLADLEARYEETGTIPDDANPDPNLPSDPDGPPAPF